MDTQHTATGQLVELAVRPSDATPTSPPVDAVLRKPPEPASLAAKIVFVVTCSRGQLVAAIFTTSSVLRSSVPGRSGEPAGDGAKPLRGGHDLWSINGAIGAKIVDDDDDDALPGDDGINVGLAGLRAICRFGLASALSGALITATLIRIPPTLEPST